MSVPGTNRHRRDIRGCPLSGAKQTKRRGTTTMGKGILAFLSAIAQDERERITKRANEGRAAAVARGGRIGRKPKLNPEQQEEALRRLGSGDSCRQIARLFKVSHTTVAKLARA